MVADGVCFDGTFYCLLWGFLNFLPTGLRALDDVHKILDARIARELPFQQETAAK